MQLFDRTLGQWLEHWAEVTPAKEYIVYSMSAFGRLMFRIG